MPGRASAGELVSVQAGTGGAAITGFAALYKATNRDVAATPLGAWLTSNATPDVISGGSTGGTPNRLVFTNRL